MLKISNLIFFQQKEEGGKEKASIEDSAFEALEKDFQDVSCTWFKQLTVDSQD